MASDLTGLIIFFIFIALILGIIAYSYISNHLATDKRKQQIKEFRASPVIAKDAPILVQGPARAPDRLLPTTGEHVAFYGLFVMSRESAVSDMQAGIPVRVQGLKLNQSRISAMKGFRFFDTSGDFIVEPGETPYLVSVTSILGYFAKGTSMVTSLVGGQVKDAGMSGDVWNDAMTFMHAQEALRMLCGFEAPIGTQNSKRRTGTWTRTETTQQTTLSVVTVKSRIDSRIHYLNAGQNIPPGIQELLTKRGIVPEEKEEIIVVETFIPLNKEVFVFGSFDGDRSIAFRDSATRLSVSYMDPEME